MIVTAKLRFVRLGAYCVRVNMIQSNNAQDRPLTLTQSKPKRHNAKLCPLAIKERIVNAIAAGDSQRAIARHLRVSPMTVRAIADQEWAQVSARKDRIAAQSERNATRAAELIAEQLQNGDVPLNVLVPVFGVSVDKSLALRADPTIHIEHSHQHIHAHIQPTSFQDLLATLRQREAIQDTPPATDQDPA